jgi:hypothetical protein
MGKYDDEGEEEMMIAESLQFNFDIIRVATSDFSDSNKLGQGGFGIVYRVRQHFYDPFVKYHPFYSKYYT